MIVERDVCTKEQKYSVYCGECSSLLTRYGLESSLLSDPRVHLISTNIISTAISPVYDPYMARSCRCAVRDVGCLQCGKIVGYHIIQPCVVCLKSKNNGHLWMFHSLNVITILNDSIPEGLSKKSRQRKKCVLYECER